MKVAVLGAGAMGSLFGGLLARAGHEVWLIDVWHEHVKAIRERGLRIRRKGGELLLRDLKAVSSPEEVGVVELVLVFVKSTATEKAIKGARVLLGEGTLVLTLQNGLGNVEQIATVVPISKILAGTTAQGATVIGPGEIYHAGEGPTAIGQLEGPPLERVREIARAFNSAGIPTEVSENVMGLIWGKLLVNVGINALTAITGLKNGELLDYPETVELMEMAVSEAWEVAKRKGIHIPSEDPVAHTKQVARATAENRSSMLQDVLNKRKTEIETINGAVVRLGREVGVETPVNKVLTNLVLMLERRYLGPSA